MADEEMDKLKKELEAQKKEINLLKGRDEEIGELKAERLNLLQKIQSLEAAIDRYRPLAMKALERQKQTEIFDDPVGPPPRMSQWQATIQDLLKYRFGPMINSQFGAPVEARVTVAFDLENAMLLLEMLSEWEEEVSDRKFKRAGLDKPLSEGASEEELAALGAKQETPLGEKLKKKVDESKHKEK